MILGITIILVVVILRLSIRAVNYPIRRMTRQGYYIKMDVHDRLQYNGLTEDVWTPIYLKVEQYSKVAPPHAINIPEDWSQFPNWAKEEKEIILERLKKKFKSPAYTFFRRQRRLKPAQGQLLNKR